MKKRYLIPAGLSIALAAAIVVTDAVQGGLSVGTLFEFMLMTLCALGFVQAGLIDELERENHWLRESRAFFIDQWLKIPRCKSHHEDNDQPRIDIKEQS